jgi:uncharacterized membrane protein SirB2
MFADHYPQLIMAHVACAILSGGIFIMRGMLRMRGAAVANAAPLRFSSYGVDSLLLLTAILLMVTSGQYPIVDAWLMVKVLLVAVYIVLGVFALKRAQTRRGRAAAFYAALIVYVYIIGVAIAHQPLGWFVLHPSPGNGP